MPYTICDFEELEYCFNKKTIKEKVYLKNIIYFSILTFIVVIYNYVL